MICERCGGMKKTDSGRFCRPCYEVNKTAGKQIAKVLDTIERHPHLNHSADISDLTGMPVAICSKYISDLIEMGLLRRTGRSYRVSSTYGSRSLFFEPISKNNS